MAAASRRFGASSFWRMCETWTLAVFTLITSAAAISRSGARAIALSISAFARGQPSSLPAVPREGLPLSGAARSSRARSASRSISRNRVGADPRRDCPRFPQGRAGVGAGGAGSDQCFGLPPSGSTPRPAGGRSSRSQAAAASIHAPGCAAPPARACSASASASQPPESEKTAEASAAAWRCD